MRIFSINSLILFTSLYTPIFTIHFRERWVHIAQPCDCDEDFSAVALQTILPPFHTLVKVGKEKYSRTSMARIPMSRLPWMSRTRS